MNTLSFDFTRGYKRGERRDSDPIAYQWDTGNQLVAQIPETSDSIELQYWQRGMAKAVAYEPGSVSTANNITTITGNIPNNLFEKNGQISVYIISTTEEHGVTTYEGIINVRYRAMPDDYVDDDPDNEAVHILAAARAAAEEAEDSAEAAEAAAEAAAAGTGMAPAFSTSVGYAAGAHVLYNGVVYRFDTAHAAGAWTGTDATAVTLGDEITGLLYDSSLKYIWTGSCSTMAQTAAKTVTLDKPDYFALTNRKTQVLVRFMFGNSQNNPTLNVNGTGALPIYYINASGQTVPLNDAPFRALGGVILFTYESLNGVDYCWMMDSVAAVTVAQISSSIGTLSELNTTAKTNIVAAINELDSEADALGLSVVDGKLSITYLE